MFVHIFSYRLKCLLRDKVTIFWTMLFPLLLATFFQLAFSNLTTGEKFKPVTIIAVDNAAWQKTIPSDGFLRMYQPEKTGFLILPLLPRKKLTGFF